MANGFDLAVADHDIGLLIQDRLYEFGNIPAKILVVGIGVDDNICSQLKGMVHAINERFCQTLVIGEF